MRRMRDPGFTLVELLIVVIILAILAAVVVPQFSASTSDARQSAAEATLANLRSVIDLYYAQHGVYPSAVGDGTNAAASKEAWTWQLARYTNGAGKAKTASDPNYPYGPYMKLEVIPLEPITQKSTIKIETTGTLGMTGEGSNPGGWRYDNKTGQIIINHQSWDHL